MNEIILQLYSAVKQNAAPGTVRKYKSESSEYLEILLHIYEVNTMNDVTKLFETFHDLARQMIGQHALNRPQPLPFSSFLMFQVQYAHIQ